MSYLSKVEYFDDSRFPYGLDVFTQLAYLGFIRVDDQGNVYQVRHFMYGNPVYDETGHDIKLEPLFAKKTGRPYFKIVVPYNSLMEPRIALAKVHQVVYALTHDYHIPDMKEVHHVDGDITNNHPDNLEALYPDEHKAIHQKGGGGKLLNQPALSRKDVVVAKIIKLRASGHSYREIEKETEIPRSTCHRIIKGTYFQDES